MRNKYFITSVTIITVSIAGLILSALLIMEYFGAAPEAADAVCARGGGVNACTIVSASPFASIKGIPLIGDLPTALFGFIFYGFIAAIVLLNMIQRKSDEIRQLYILVLILSGIAFLADIVLYLISVFIIKFVCPLCVMTYTATVVILLSSILMLKNNRSAIGELLIIRLAIYLKNHILTFILIAVVLSALGISIGAGARTIAQAKDASTYEERLNKEIRKFETAKETDISLTEAPVFGNSDAKAKFVIFFDFTCVHCMDEFLVLEKMIQKYPDEISVAFKFFPLNGSCGMLKKGRDDIDAEACIASAAAFCSHNQGKFLEYAKILFDNYHNKGFNFSQQTVRNAAKTAGLDLAGFDLCFGSRTAREFVNMEYMETESLNISSTPTMYLNGKKLTAHSRKADVLEGLVQYCIKRNK